MMTWEGDMEGSRRGSESGTMDFRRAGFRRAISFDRLLPMFGQTYADELCLSNVSGY